MKKAFTLIEVLVVISIIGLLGGIFWANYQGSERHSQLGSARDTFLQNLRLAQTNTLIGTELEGAIPAGWGLHISASSSSYIIFADQDADYMYDEGEAVSAISLSEGVEFYKIGGTLDNSALIESELVNSVDLYPLILPLDMTFDYETKNLIIQDSDSVLVNVAIILRETNESVTTAIFANSTGLLTAY
jgi:prepilin-type N-terminal cleavage/methylation domain-containing protein